MTFLIPDFFFPLVDKDTESLKYNDQQKMKHYFSQKSGGQDNSKIKNNM